MGKNIRYTKKVAQLADAPKPSTPPVKKLLLRIDNSLFEQLREYRFEHRIDSMNEAIERILRERVGGNKQ